MDYSKVTLKRVERVFVFAGGKQQGQEDAADVVHRKDSRCTLADQLQVH